ncbi:DUF2244 domain-containing protein [Ottowia sp. VDI28]|uniref:DUF2244 domain-containing protein n=1 Tax=Ottowia sp. VDI28 TaxID=3133968 RepID=UPI003C2DD5B9
MTDQAFDWRLRRNCSVTPRQLMLLYASLCLVSLLIGVWFWALGAKLVIGFAGIELLAVGLAFLAYARHAADGETVSLRGGRLIVEQECAGKRERMEFGCAQVRIESCQRPQALIEVCGPGGRVKLGRYIQPDLRPLLAGEIRRALRESNQAGRF